MNPKQPKPSVKCIRCGREVPRDPENSGAQAEDTLCSRCYEKMLFPQSRLQNMEIFD